MPFRTYGEGELLDSEDLDQDNDATRDIAGAATQLILSAVMGNAVPSPVSPSGPQPLNVIPGTGLQVVAGGANQSVLVTGRIATSCPATTFSVPPNSGSVTRTDSLAVKFANPTELPQTRPIEHPDTTIDPSGTVYSVAESVQWQYVVGSLVPPAGYQAFASISVPVGASSITTGEITILFPSVATLLGSIVGGLSSLNGLTGAVTVAAGIGMSSTTNVGTRIITLNNAGVQAVNGITGSLTVNGGTGIGIATTGHNLVITNTGVTSTAGLVGHVGLAAGPGIAVGFTGNTIDLDNTGVLTLNGQAGNVTLATSGPGLSVSTPSAGVVQVTLTPVLPVGGIVQNAVASTNGTSGGGNGPGSLSLVLPGTGAMTFSVTVECTIGVGGSDSSTLTTTGGSFPGTPTNWAVGNFASYIHQYDYNVAVGGNTITATNSKGHCEFFRIQAVRTA
jgi:hypothetical protein